MENSHGFTCAIGAAKDGNIEILKILRDIHTVKWNLTNKKGVSALSMALKNNDMEAVRIILSVPSLEIAAHQLRELNVPRHLRMECMKSVMVMANRANSNLNSLMSSLGGGSMECHVCLIPFTAQRKVFQCGNGHFTCGDCKRHIQVNILVCPSTSP